MFLPRCALMYKSDRNAEIVYMSFEETDTDESASSLSEVSSLDDDFDHMRLECGSSDSEVTDEEVDSRS
jgi:hypothetical protein